MSSNLNHIIPSNIEKPILISIPGSAGLFPVTISLGYSVHKMIKTIYPTREIHYAGTSSGCLPALCLALGFTFDQTMTWYERFINYFDTFYKVPITYWYQG